VVVTATAGIAAQGLSKKLPEHYGTVSTIHKFVGLKDGRYENDESLFLVFYPLFIYNYVFPNFSF
jgi:hypothetical protein